MVVNTLMKILSSYGDSNSKRFNKIINRFSPEYKLEESDFLKLEKAFKLGDEAHKNQKRSSGERYFDHCIEVCLQLIDWNMDINTIIAGLLHDTIEDLSLIHI